MMREKKIVILGAGPCGMGAAWRLQELGHSNFELLEASNKPSGLACTEVDENGFLWDMGGHVVFSHYKYFDELLDVLNQNWCERERVCYVWQFGRFIPYPYQNNIHRLPQKQLQQCLSGLLENVKIRSAMTKPKNFLEWLSNAMGSGIVDLFLRPYNRKVWGYDPSEMNTEWMGERVATVDLNRIMNNIVTGEDDASWGPNNQFRFPLYGGSGFVWDNLSEKINSDKVHLNSKVTSVNSADKVLTLENGCKVDYDYLISTIPLDTMCSIIEDKTDPRIHHFPVYKSDFRYSSTHVIGIGVSGTVPEKLKKQCWMYFPEDDCPFYRVTVFSNYSPYNVPKDQVGKVWSLMAEVCETSNRPVSKISKEVIDSVIRGMVNTKLLTKEDAKENIVTKYHRRLEHGYPTPFAGREELCKPIFSILEEKDIYSRGRFGAWKYEVSNQDHSLMQGVEAVDHILYGSEETTFRFPSVVNNKQWKNVGRGVKCPVPDVNVYNAEELLKKVVNEC